MLDYDALRSKVKKLTEKPDKDPGKLPRTEKEMEMVSLQRFLDDDKPLHSRTHTSMATTTTATTTTAGLTEPSELDLDMPSLPKVLQRPEIEKLKRERPLSSSLIRSPSIFGRSVSWKSFDSTQTRTPADPDSETTRLLPSPTRSISTARTSQPSGPSGETVKYREVTVESPMGTFTMPIKEPKHQAKSPKVNTYNKLKRRPTPISIHSPSTPVQPQAQFVGPPRVPRHPTPFFEPAELETIMAPVRSEYIQKQADDLEQAKTSYEQLNEQLTSELPQLIDLRVPYLDPSFEALVKIQLRFCAEAYSRMAQVQQYVTIFHFGCLGYSTYFISCTGTLTSPREIRTPTASWTRGWKKCLGR